MVEFVKPFIFEETMCFDIEIPSIELEHNLGTKKFPCIYNVQFMNLDYNCHN